MINQEQYSNITITSIESNNTSRTFLPPELYLPEWARDTEFFRCMTILLNYVQNSLKDFSNPKYAMIEQAYKDINFKYKDILQISEECLRAMLTENGFGKILEIFELSLEQLQMITLYLPLLKIMKGTDEGYRLFLSLFASDFEIETWLDNPQELEEYTFNILFVSWVNVGISSNFVQDFIEFSKSYVYPILKNVEMFLTYKYLSPSVYCRPKLQVDITATCNEDIVNDGTAWNAPVQNANLGNRDWSSIANDGTRFVALSESSFTSESINGTTWTTSSETTGLNSLSSNDYWKSMTYGNNKFVALSRKGYISETSNTSIWSNASLNNELSYDNHWISLCYGAGKFVALSSYGYVSTSINGINYQTLYQISDSTSLSWSDLTYSGLHFIALNNSGYTSVSTDGTTWTTPKRTTLNIATSRGWRDITYCPYSHSDYHDTQYDSPFFVAIQNNGYYGIADVSNASESDSWYVYTDEDSILSSAEVTWCSSACGNNKLIALSTSGYVSVATDFNDTRITWSTPQQNSNLSSTSLSWYRLLFDGEKFIALNENGYMSTSTDGTTWTVPTKESALGSTTGWRGIACNNGKLAIVSRSAYVSAIVDVIGWSTATSTLGTNSWTSIVYNGTKFVALGAEGYISTSTDGTTWTTPTLNTLDRHNEADWSLLVYGAGKFVAITTSGWVSTSTDGTTWATPVQNTNLGSNTWYSAIYAEDHFTLIGYNGAASTSINGIDWDTAITNTGLTSGQWVDIDYNANDENANYIAINARGFVSTSKYTIR